MGETEVRTAEASGTVTNKSSQRVTPKSKSSKRSSAPAKSAKLNARGVPVTQWDNPKLDPNKRKHVGEDPTGESNKP
jgi:hypothetical protein